MRFLANDGQFGLLVTPVENSGMSRFQLVVEGQLIGDTESSFAYGAFEEMANLPRFSDRRLGLLSEEPDTALSALLSEEELHDPATLSLAESLDRWLVQGYLYAERVLIVARPHDGGSPAEPVLVSIVNCSEYAVIVEMARLHWAHTDERFRSTHWRVMVGSGEDQGRVSTEIPNPND